MATKTLRDAILKEKEKEWMMTMETTEKDFQEVAQRLSKIQKMIQNLMETSAFRQERIILEYIGALCSKKEALTPVKDACEQTLERYQTEVNYYETSLVDEAIALLENPYKKALPATWFEKDILFYKLGYAVIEEEFKPFESMGLERRYQLIVDNLKRIVFNSFVNDPNFKGENPYYKRHYYDFERSKKVTRELIDQEFSNFIAFFEGE